MGRLLLVRHGESEANAKRRYTESDLVPLTPAGREQAERTAAFLLARFTPIRIVSSPFTRAYQTAETIAGLLGLPIEIDPALREQSFGELRGEPYDAAVRTPGYDELPRWEWRPPGGETLLEVQSRSIRTLLSIARGSIGQDVILSSHAGTIQSCWAHIDGTWDAVPRVPNCGVVVVEHDGAEFGEPELLVPNF